jgi:hypothetical protein
MAVGIQQMDDSDKNNIGIESARQGTQRVPIFPDVERAPDKIVGQWFLMFWHVS